jgi:hypothetical protein
VRDTAERKQYALKVIDCNNPSTTDVVKRIQQETITLTEGRHEQMVQIKTVDNKLLSKKLLFLVLTELCSDGDLNARLNEPREEKTNLK